MTWLLTAFFVALGYWGYKKLPTEREEKILGPVPGDGGVQIPDISDLD